MAHNLASSFEDPPNWPSSAGHLICRISRPEMLPFFKAPPWCKSVTVHQRENLRVVLQARFSQLWCRSAFRIPIRCIYHLYVHRLFCAAAVFSDRLKMARCKSLAPATRVMNSSLLFVPIG